MIEFSAAYESDLPALEALWQSAFGDGPETIRLFFERMFRPENTCAAKENGELRAALYLLPAQIILSSERSEPVYYLYAAATKPEFRRRGIMRALLSYAAQIARERGKAALCLLPGEESLVRYYLRCGYREYFAARRVILPYKAPSKETVRFECDDPKAVREAFLKETPGSILFPETHVSFAKRYYRFVSAKNAYAMISEHDGALCRVSELFAAPEDFDLLFSRICEEYPAKEYEIHTAADCLKGFGSFENRGMILPLGESEIPETKTAYLGLTLE